MKKLQSIDQLPSESNLHESQILPISAIDLVRFSPYLGIPYFQRGSVWKDEDKALLLLSLFKKTPCGTIILWKVDDSNKKFGTSLLNKDGFEALFDEKYQENEIKYWVVDGQQRIRSMISIYKNMLSDGSKQNGDYRSWAVNLRMLPEFKNGYFSSVKKESPLFVNTKYKHNYLNLRKLYEGIIEDDFIESSDNHKVKDIINKEYINKNESNRFNHMFKEKQFGCSVVAENMVDLVDMYNRINSSGVKVNSEEKAYATLIKLNTDATLNNIKDLFTELNDYDDTDDFSFDYSPLDRAKETSFGFKLYLRIFILAAQYHLFPAKKDMYLDVNFNQVQEAKIQSVIMKNQGRIKLIWEETNKIIKLIFDVFEKELHCDDTRFIPNAYSIRFVAYLLLKFKELREDRKAIASLLITSYITSLEESKIKKIFAIDKTNNEDEGIKFTDIKDILIGNKDAFRGQIEKFISESNSINHPAVKLLYWLLRKNGAMDFPYNRNKLIGRDSSKEGTILPNKKLVVSKSSNIQIQHIIPFAKLEKMGISASRSGKCDSNLIGNLTMISGNLNWNLKDNFLNLDKEDDEVLKQHFLDNEIRKAYNNIQRKIGEGTIENIEKVYAEFCELRRDQICDNLLEWIEDIYNQNKICNLSINSRFIDTNKELDTIMEDTKNISINAGWHKLYDENMLQLKLKEFNGYCFYFIRDNQDEERTFHIGLSVDKGRIKDGGTAKIEKLMRDSLGILELENETEEINDKYYVMFYYKLMKDDINKYLALLCDNKEIDIMIKENVHTNKRKTIAIDELEGILKNNKADNLYLNFCKKAEDSNILSNNGWSNSTIQYYFKSQKKHCISLLVKESDECLKLGLLYNQFNAYYNCGYNEKQYFDHFKDLDCYMSDNYMYFMTVSLHGENDIDNFITALKNIPKKER